MTTHNKSRYRRRAIDRNRDAPANNFVLRGAAASGERALEYLIRRRVGEAVKLIRSQSDKSRETLPFEHATTQAGMCATKVEEVEPFSRDSGKHERVHVKSSQLISHEVDVGSEIGVVKHEVIEHLSSIEQEVDSNLVKQEMFEDSQSFEQQFNSSFVKKEAEDSEYEDSPSFEQETESTFAKQEMTEHSTTFVETDTSVMEHEMVNDLQSFPQEMQVSSVQHERIGNFYPFSRRAHANHTNYLYEVAAGCSTHSHYPMLENWYVDSMAYSPNDTSMNYLTNKTLIHRLPSPAPEGIEVVYTIDPVEVEAWLRNNVTDCSAKAVGFDIRWKPQLNKKRGEGGVQKKTAVLQLAVENSCLVLHLHHLKSRAFPKVFRSVLKDKLIRKVGSAVLQNVTMLKQDRQLKCLGIVDLEEMARACGVSSSHKCVLKGLAQHFLGVELNKSKSALRSNWEKFPLSLQQIEHAAVDAWFSLKVFQHMEKELENEKCSPYSTVVQGETEGAVVEQCSVCRKQFESKDGLSRHVKNLHKMCFCGELFRVKINKAHKENCVAFRQAAQLTVCEACGKKCKSEVSLENHIRKAQHVRCSVCNKLLQRQALGKHEKKCKSLDQI